MVEEHNSDMRCIAAFLLLAGSGFAQTGVPRIATDNLFRRDGREFFLAPGMIIELYGENLAPNSGCDQSIPQNGPYPQEMCGVQVLVDGRAAGLLFVGSKQINLKLPVDAPEEGSAPIQVCVREVCSDVVNFRFSAHKAYVHLVGHAYVHMPVWIEVEEPAGHDIHYPYSVFPLNLGDNELEVFHRGEPLAPFRTARPSFGGTSAPKDSPAGRLPLHLLYRFDEPGKYSVRYTARSDKQIQSDWTEITVEPYTDAQRLAWLRSEAEKARSATPGELTGDIIPSILAVPDEASLAVLLTLVDHPDGMVRDYVRLSLALFDEALQRRVIPANRWDELHRFMVVIG